MVDSQSPRENESAPVDLPGTLLALGIEPRLIRACLLEPVAGVVRLAGWINVQRDPTSDLTRQIRIVCQRMGRRLGRRLWDEEADAPFLFSEDPVAWPPIHQVLAASGPRALLRVWLAGLSHSGGMRTAAEAVTAAPALVVGHHVLTAASSGAALASSLSAARPDAVVITGGYDNPAVASQRPVTQLAKVVADALRRLPPGQHPLVIYAGDRWQATPVVETVRAVGDALSVEVVSNVRPTPTAIDQTPLAAALTQRHWQLSQRLPGFTRLGDWVTKPAQIVSMESAFAQCARVWMDVHGLPELHALYFASGWRLHVWVTQDEAILLMRYAEPDAQPLAPEGWPRIELVSGLPRENQDALAPRWWDHSGMLPTVATVGQVAPAAMIQVLRQDLLETA